MSEHQRGPSSFEQDLWPSATRPAQGVCSPVLCCNGPSPSPSTTQRGTGFTSDLLANIQGLAQDRQPGYSPPAAAQWIGREEVSLWHFSEGLGSPTPLSLPSSKTAELSTPQLLFPPPKLCQSR